MHKLNIQTKQIGLFLVLLISVCVAQADEFRARLVKVQGEVYVINKQGEERAPEKNSYLINQNETVVTREGGKAVVQFDDGAMSVLDEKSSLRVEQAGWLSQLSGKVFYVFRKVFGKKQPKVKTQFATIGIRGTTFIVYATGDTSGIALKEGKINIQSPGEAYAIHRKQQAGDFDAFKQQMRESQQAMEREFQQYKKDIQDEFVEYKKSFDLEANRIIEFDGNRVNENELSGDVMMEFEQFESFSQDYIDAYKELDEETL